MEFTDRLMATDRAVSSYIRFAGEPHPSPSETAEDMLADLLHWHERFVISEPPMNKREVRRMVNAAVKRFYEEREAMEKGERVLDRPRREHPPEVLEARRQMRAEEDRLLRQMRGARPVPVDPGPTVYIPDADVPLPAAESPFVTLARETALARHPDGCDHCGRVVELYHNDRTGLSLCETCDDMANTDEEVRPGLDIPADPRGDDYAF